MNSLNVFMRGLPVTLFLAVAACSDPSKNTIWSLVKENIEQRKAVTWCLNPVKIKSTGSNLPLGLWVLDPSADSESRMNGVVSTAAFPLIFAEEAFVKWSDPDVYIMTLLVAGKYIAVHEGGYPGSQNEPGKPGKAYDPTTTDQVEAIIEVIREKGAVVDLTTKGLQEGIWDAESGFCVRGVWELYKITGWTAAAADSNGKLVTHIEADERFHPTSLGAAKTGLNPMGFTYTMYGQEFVAAKFNDGWRIISGK